MTARGMVRDPGEGAGDKRYDASAMTIDAYPSVQRTLTTSGGPKEEKTTHVDRAHMSETRRILHIDMDAFFASVEQMDNPALRGRPVVVGGSRARGVVAAASYEARQFGVRSAMPSVTARRRCPELIFVPPRFDRYREISSRIQEIFHRYTDLVEPLSLDEAYLDVTEDRAGLASATATAEHIRARIREEVGLTASAGVSYCKFLAKIASDQNKPDGLFVIRPSQGPDFVAVLPVGKIHGIGPATERRMHEMGIVTGADLRGRSLGELVSRFGKAGQHYHDIARGIDARPVRPDRERKSVGAEITFEHDLRERDDLVAALGPVLDRLAERMQRAGLATGRTVTLKLKFADFSQITRSHTAPRGYRGIDPVRDGAVHLLDGECPVALPVRLIGVILSGFDADMGPASGYTQMMLDLDTPAPA